MAEEQAAHDDHFAQESKADLGRDEDEAHEDEQAAEKTHGRYKHQQARDYLGPPR